MPPQAGLRGLASLRERLNSLPRGSLPRILFVRLAEIPRLARIDRLAAASADRKPGPYP